MVFGEILSVTPSAVDTYSFKGGLEARFLVSLCKRSAFLAPTCWGRKWGCSSSLLYLLTLSSTLYSCNSIFILVSALILCPSFSPPLFLLHFSVQCLIKKLKHSHQWHYLWPLYSEIKYFWLSHAFIFLGSPVLNILMSNISKPVHYLLLAISLFPFIANVSIIWNIFTKMFFWLELLK